MTLEKTSSGKVLSWSDFSQLYSSLEKFRILFSKEYNFPLNKITTYLHVSELEKDECSVVLDLFKDVAFVVQGSIQNRLTMIIWKKNSTYEIIK